VTGQNQPFPVEPSAELRQAARHMREWFCGLVSEGFSEAQACRIIAGAGLPDVRR